MSSTNVFMDELVNQETGETDYQCNDTSYCLIHVKRRRAGIGGGNSNYAR